MTDHHDRNQKAAEKKLESSLDPAKRDLCDKLDVLLAATMNADKRINSWELNFLSDILEQYGRYYTAIRLSQKQIDIVEKIHDKVKDVFVI
jgi:hypothetical protein